MLVDSVGHASEDTAVLLFLLLAAKQSREILVHRKVSLGAVSRKPRRWIHISRVLAVDAAGGLAGFVVLRRRRLRRSTWRGESV
jgi:hypothetical protein